VSISQPRINKTRPLHDEHEAHSVVEMLGKLRLPFELTHLDKLLFRETGFTKADLTAYLLGISPWMLPHVAGRPLMIVCGPDRSHREFFVQKHAHEGMPEAIDRLAIDADKGALPCIAIQDALGLLALAQQGALEIHTWACHGADVEHPDQLVFDLDPDEGLAFARLVEGALQVRDALAELELESFVKTTGGKGLHVVVPLVRGHDWNLQRDFARAFAHTLARKHPSLFVATAEESERPQRVFIDFMRNERGATAIAPYSPRANDRGSVATPISWNELASGSAAPAFDLRSVTERVTKLEGDPWRGRLAVQSRLIPKLLSALDRP
jgi:bifunctional non-homologous end joining protein LigD